MDKCIEFVFSEGKSTIFSLYFTIVFDKFIHLNNLYICFEKEKITFLKKIDETNVRCQIYKTSRIISHFNSKYSITIIFIKSFQLHVE